jgi:hypothetical protein
VLVAFDVDVIFTLLAIGGIILVVVVVRISIRIVACDLVVGLTRVLVGVNIESSFSILELALNNK